MYEAYSEQGNSGSTCFFAILCIWARGEKGGGKRNEWRVDEQEQEQEPNRKEEKRRKRWGTSGRLLGFQAPDVREVGQVQSQSYRECSASTGSKY